MITKIIINTIKTVIVIIVSIIYLLYIYLVLKIVYFFGTWRSGRGALKE